ncbi:DASH family cryptochrome [Gillisia hiemivivida]|uniref:Cryptochrome DASH n=1 Tax=Gillisia hiemivivida TaxID=291190 RepID=A0A5C6ZYM7_9FLAO|nr:DASH family cryptochrome [Gillisia hiemivivida]TXD93949.1 DASH family cryptochrome [Gillisia hiemivivida]
MKKGLVWFKNDLRLHDNEALCQAIANCDELIFCYCVEKSLFKDLKLGFKKSGINRFKFLEESVNNLKFKLEGLDGHLLISEITASEFIPEIVNRYDITEIFGECEYGYEELQLVNSVQKKLPKVQFNFYWGKTLYHIDDIPFKISEIPLTSKAYRIPASKESSPRIPFQAPSILKSIPNISSTDFPSYADFGFSKAEYDNASVFVKGGEDNGLERLQYYTFNSELLTGYRWTRNKSLGLDYSSKFSPYLALGCLSPREIYSAVIKYEEQIKKNQSTWWIVFELVWRDYFTFKGMRFGDMIFKTEGFKKKKVEFENNIKLFKRWCEGQTGIPFIDAHMRQLNETGYMSNRGRVNCASYFVHDLNIDWTWGAAYFESRLIDYDVSANWLNWHVQAYEIYYTNPVHQSNKYKAQEYIRLWIPELKDKNDVEVLIPWEFEIESYSKPIEIYKKWTRAINLIKKLEIE